MIEEMKRIKMKFYEIKKLEFIKSINNLTNGGGLTLEVLLNAEGKNKCYPDLNGIELKSLNQYWKKDINLFCDTPLSNKKSTIHWLVKNYGYPRKYNDKRKIFNGRINAINHTKVGLSYYFKLNINVPKKIIILEIYNSDKKIINNEIYWDFNILKHKLEIKLKYLAIIHLEKKYINKEQYCKYNNIKFYKLKNFNKFIELIEKGIIQINISTSYVTSENNIKKLHNNGTKFVINEKDIEKLFTKIYI